MVAETCSDYFNRYRRQTHVTPKSYLSFISGYKTIYSRKRAEIGNLAERMKTGLKKLVEGWLAGWLVGWLAGWLASLLALLAEIVLPDPNSFDFQFTGKSFVILKLSMIFLEASPRG